jgi:hypothetical protein
MIVASMEPSQLQTPDDDRGWLRYSLRTLLVSVTLAAGLCSIGFYAGPTTALVILGVVVGSGAIGTLAARHARGFVRGAAYGCHVSLLAILLISAYCFSRAPKREEGNNQRRKPPAMTRSAEEVFRAVHSLVPSARRLPQDVKGGDVLCGHYDDDLLGIGLAGAEVYLFPDKTYICLEWADISPRTICDQGTWDYHDGVVALRTDGTVPFGIGYWDNRYVPLMATPRGLFASLGEVKERVLLLGAQTRIDSFLESAGRGDADASTLSIYTFGQTETISPSGTKAVKNRLYADCAPEELQWRLRGAGYARASAVMFAISVIAIVILRRNRRIFPLEQTRRPGRPQQATVDGNPAHSGK